MLACIFSAVTSLLIALFLLRYLHIHQHLTGDPTTQEPQKYHLGKIPRVGGIPIFIGIIVGIVIQISMGRLPTHLGLFWLFTAIPVFGAGLAEDLSKRVSVMWRLLASFISAGIGCWLLGAIIHRLDIPGIDSLLAGGGLVAIVLTVFVVGGLCHALNLIDGYNGLSGGVAVIVLLALSYVAFTVNDLYLLRICLIIVGATLGFLVWNYPRGLIFAGDGGAYLLGFMIAEISVLLVLRNPRISPWFPFTLVMYPVWETLFTIYRRKYIRGVAAGLPDALHLHQMIFNRLVRWTVGKRELKSLRLRNSMTTPYLWGMGLLTVIPAMFFWKNTFALQMCCLLFIIIYIWLYTRIVRFKAPGWLVMHKS